MTKPLGIAVNNNTVNVINYGAKGDGKTDDSKAFLTSFVKACQVGNGVMLVPSGYTFLLQTITFMGTNCQPNFTMLLEGKIMAPQKSGLKNPDFQWILFSYFSKGLIIKGDGIVDGNGQSWWNTGGERPQAFKIGNSNYVKLSGITVQNSPMFHVFLDTCQRVTILNVTVRSPKDSPNTDGIHLTNTQHVEISNCPIAVGDDCVSMLSGVSDVKIHNVHCGPGHGYSIGGLGRYKEQAMVRDISVYDSSVFNALAGVRIKTWQGGSGSVSNISFTNIEMSNVESAIVIDQFYCGGPKNCSSQDTKAVAISGVTYKGIHGTFINRPVDLECSKYQPCRKLEFATINLTPVTSQPASNGSNNPLCSNAYGKVLTATTPSLTKCLRPEQVKTLRLVKL